MTGTLATADIVVPTLHARPQLIPGGRLVTTPRPNLATLRATSVLVKWPLSHTRPLGFVPTAHGVPI